MGKRIRRQAEKLGLFHFPTTTLYARPWKLRPTFSMLVGDIVDVIRDYLRKIDPYLLLDRSGAGRSNTHYFLAPQAFVYVEIIRKTAGMNANDPGNMVTKIDIFSKYHAHVINIASRVDSIFPNGILAHLDWNKIENKFLVSRDAGIATWHSLLSEAAVEEKPSAEELARREAEREEFDEKLKLIELDERERTKRARRTLDKYRD